MDTKSSLKTILLIDDDIDFLDLMQPQLKKAGFNVITAEGQDEAEKLLKELTPDLVISDLMMENFDGGFGIAYKVKKINKNIPVIIVTNVMNDVGLKFTLASMEEQNWIKADALLNKPIRFEQLMKEINKLLMLEIH